MKKIDIETVNYIANLAKLQFTEEESLKLAHEFESILTNFETLDKLDLSDINLNLDPNAKSILREDKPVLFEDKKKLFQNTKSMKDTAIMVPKIIE